MLHLHTKTNIYSNTLETIRAHTESTDFLDHQKISISWECPFNHRFLKQVKDDDWTMCIRCALLASTLSKLAFSFLLFWNVLHVSSVVNCSCVHGCLYRRHHLRQPPRHCQLCGRIMENMSKCRHLKKLTCEETLRQVLICLKPPPLLGCCVGWSSNL